MTNGFADSWTSKAHSEQFKIVSFAWQPSPELSHYKLKHLFGRVQLWIINNLALLRYLRIISDTLCVFSSKVFERNSFARFRRPVISLQIIFLRAAFKLIIKPYEISQMSHGIGRICIKPCFKRAGWLYGVTNDNIFENHESPLQNFSRQIIISIIWSRSLALYQSTFLLRFESFFSSAVTTHVL